MKTALQISSKLVVLSKVLRNTLTKERKLIPLKLKNKLLIKKALNKVLATSYIKSIFKIIFKSKNQLFKEKVLLIKKIKLKETKISGLTGKKLKRERNRLLFKKREKLENILSYNNFANKYSYIYIIFIRLFLLLQYKRIKDKTFIFNFNNKENSFLKLNLFFKSIEKKDLELEKMYIYFLSLFCKDLFALKKWRIIFLLKKKTRKKILKYKIIKNLFKLNFSKLYIKKSKYIKKSNYSFIFKFKSNQLKKNSKRILKNLRQKDYKNYKFKKNINKKIIYKYKENFSLYKRKKKLKYKYKDLKEKRLKKLKAKKMKKKYNYLKIKNKYKVNLLLENKVIFSLFNNIRNFFLFNFLNLKRENLNKFFKYSELVFLK